MTRRKLVKLHCEQWLRGSIRKESIEVRAAFTDLLALAGDNAYGPDVGIQLAEDVGFTDEVLAGILNVPLEVWLKAKERLSNHPVKGENRIEVTPLMQGFAIKVLNWDRYQADYQRQKKYQQAYHERLKARRTMRREQMLERARAEAAAAKEKEKVTQKEKEQEEE